MMQRVEECPRARKIRRVQQEGFRDGIVHLARDAIPLLIEPRPVLRCKCQCWHSTSHTFSRSRVHVSRKGDVFT